VKILITGICGFTGSTLAKELAKEGNEVCGLDNFLREGSRGNVEPLRKLGIRVEEGDIRNEADLAKMPKADWVLDCAAEPSVLAGVAPTKSGQGSGMGSYELMDHNLIGTIRVLELCKSTGAGLILLSTSRVYSVQKLSALNVEAGKIRIADCGLGIEGSAKAESERRKAEKSEIVGLTSKGISEEFSTEPPLSLYGASKRCAELLAMEYGDAFGFPVWINRCGVLAGKGQFGKADQGIFSFWIRSWKENRPLKYIGFDGKGSQVRDCLHPVDLLPALNKQMKASGAGLGLGLRLSKPEDGGLRTEERVDPRICNFGGGVGNSCSLAQLSEWCEKRFGARKVESDPKPRPYDLPWVVLDSSRAERLWGFEVKTSLEQIFKEIADA
jgi:CDP-paratose 2-epimerase